MKITIFTPTYNRCEKLKKLYSSLLNQTYNEFEWIIVDDGSTDETDLFIESIKSVKLRFQIIYIKQNNSGKHVAINKGVENASGELFFIVDSDDYLPSGSLEIIVNYINNLPKCDKFAGVGGLKAFTNEEIVGKTFSEKFVDCTSLERNKNNILGDKAEVFYTEILKKYPFPFFEGENFLTESLVWYRIANDGYKIRWFNEIIYFCEYCEDGLTKKKSKYYDNYNGFLLQVKEELSYKEISIIEKIKKLCVCLGYSKYKKMKIKYISGKLQFNLILTWLFREIGYIILRFILRKKYE